MKGPYPASEKPNSTPSATPRRVSAGTGKGKIEAGWQQVGPAPILAVEHRAQAAPDREHHLSVACIPPCSQPASSSQKVPTDTSGKGQTPEAPSQRSAAHPKDGRATDPSFGGSTRSTPLSGSLRSSLVALRGLSNTIEPVLGMGSGASEVAPGDGNTRPVNFADPVPDPAVSGCEHSLRPAAAPERRGVVADTPPASLTTPRLSWSAWRALRIQSHCLHLEAFINGTITEEAFFNEERSWMELRLWETA